MVSIAPTRAGVNMRARRPGRKPSAQRVYPLWFYAPAGVLFLVFFVIPTVSSFYFSFTRWTLFDSEFIGFENYIHFFENPQLYTGLINTILFGFLTSLFKVVLGLGLAVLLTSSLIGRGYLRSVVFFPVLVSTIGIGLTFKALLDPFGGPVNTVLQSLGIGSPGWLVDPNLAIYTLIGIEVWRGLGIACLIYIAGLAAIPQEYYEAARVDGAGRWKAFKSITVPLVKPATATVVILSLVDGLRKFDLIWATTRGGPGFSSDVLGSVIYKQYQAGFYGLSTAGNVILFLLVTVIMIPVTKLLNRNEVEH